ncbi:hypothetical protein [Longitalea arenae]|uniref:hypothetical protein n=1 Tax=Longitalea arenae TaxID=2812558 RepID=UPI0019684402|nr:hypothetical protein [Longitalea arenae]
MQKFLLYSFLGLALFVACSKDKFEDKPTIEIKSINPTYVSALSGAYAEIEMEFTDKQGDLDSVFLYKNRLNINQKPLLNPYLPYPLPDFPEKSKGVLKVTLQNTDLAATGSPNTKPDEPFGKEPDTINFKIVVKDKSGNVSDTITTDQLIIERS